MKVEEAFVLFYGEIKGSHLKVSIPCFPGVLRKLRERRDDVRSPSNIQYIAAASTASEATCTYCSGSCKRSSASAALYGGIQSQCTIVKYGYGPKQTTPLVRKPHPPSSY